MFIGKPHFQSDALWDATTARHFVQGLIEPEPPSASGLALAAAVRSRLGPSPIRAALRAARITADRLIPRSRAASLTRANSAFGNTTGMVMPRSSTGLVRP